VAVRSPLDVIPGQEAWTHIKPFRPRGWFLLPLPLIEQAITRLLDGSILRYRFDAKSEKIIEAEAASSAGQASWPTNVAQEGCV
jgi:hypothetical protein